MHSDRQETEQIIDKRKQLNQLGFFECGRVGGDKTLFPFWGWVYIPIEEKFTQNSQERLPFVIVTLRKYIRVNREINRGWRGEWEQATDSERKNSVQVYQECPLHSAWKQPGSWRLHLQRKIHCRPQPPQGEV